MSNPNKDKGTRAETKVARYFGDHGLPTERRALAGSADNGDLRTILPDGGEITVEVKTGVQTRNYTRSQMETWRRQTLAESRNAGCPGILVVVRYNRRFVDSEVWAPLPDGSWSMTYVDEYVERMGGQ